MEVLPLERPHVVGMDRATKLTPQCRREVVVDDSGKHLVGCSSKTKRKPEKATSNKSKESSTKVLNNATKNKRNTNESKKKNKIENSFKYPAVSLVDPKAKGKQGKGAVKTGSTQQSKSAGKKQQTKMVKFGNTEVIAPTNVANASMNGPLLLLKKKYECADFFAPGYLQNSSVQYECSVRSYSVLDKVEEKIRDFDRDPVDGTEEHEVERETETSNSSSACVADKAEQEVVAETKGRYFVSDCVLDEAHREVVTDVPDHEYKAGSEHENKAESENESKAECTKRYFCNEPAADKAEHEDETECEASERRDGVTSVTAATDIIGKDAIAKLPTTATEIVEIKVGRIHYGVGASLQENNKKDGSLDYGSSECVTLVANESGPGKSIQSPIIIGASCNIVSDTQPAEIGNVDHRGEGESCVVPAGRRYSSDEGYAEDQSQNVSVDCENELCQFKNPNEFINCENKMCGGHVSQDVASECRKEPLSVYNYKNKLHDYETEGSSENQSQTVSDYYENRGSCGEQIHNLASHFVGNDCAQNAITYCNATNQNLLSHSFQEITKNVDSLHEGGNILFQEHAQVLKTTDHSRNMNGTNDVIEKNNGSVALRYAKTALSSYDAVPTCTEGDAVRPKRKDEPITVNDKLTTGLNSADNIPSEGEFEIKENDVSVSKNKKFEICEDQPVFCATSDCADVNMNTQFLPEGAVKDSFYNCVYFPFGLINIPQQPENTRPCQVILKRLSSWDVQRKNDLEDRLVTLYRSLHERTRNWHMTTDIQEEIRKCEDQYEDFLNEYLDFPSR